jgi:hypothetical protein
MIANQIAGLLTSGAPPAVGDYESISTTNGSGSSATITLSSIPSTYKHLQLRMIVKGTSTSGGYANTCRLNFNSDTTATNYYNHYMLGDGSSATSGSSNSFTGFPFVSTGSAASANGAYSAHVIDILDYASTSKYKTLRALTGVDTNGNGGMVLGSMLWKNTAAISSLTFSNTDGTYFGNFTTGSSFALYGIK